MKQTNIMTQMFLPGLVTALDQEVSIAGPEAAGLKVGYEVRRSECQRCYSLPQAKRVLGKDSRRTLWRVWYHSSVVDGAALYEEALPRPTT